MQTVEIYTKPYCPYCARALGLLAQKGVDFTEYEDASTNMERKREMMHRAGGRATFPQVFIGGEHVGGSDELAALERDGRLDAKLAA